MGLFRRRSVMPDRAYEPLQPDEQALFRAVLAGEGPGMTALRSQAERGLGRGVVRQAFSFSYQVMLVSCEVATQAEALPGFPDVVLDDVVVRVEEVPDVLVARARVQDGSLTSLDLRAEGRSDHPKHLTFTTISYRQSDGTEASRRDPAVLAEFERGLALTVPTQAPPVWLERSGLALRTVPRLSSRHPATGALSHLPDVRVLADWALPTRLGSITLLGGDEFVLADGGEVVIANGVDGSAYVVTQHGHVLHHALDRSLPHDLGPLRTWLRRIAGEQ